MSIVMYQNRQFIQPSSPEEAFVLMRESRRNRLIGGGCWLALQRCRFNTLIDLSKLSISNISETECGISIGANTVLRDMETSPILRRFTGCAMSQCLSRIMGVQIRNRATLGGTVASRFGFSDLLPLLLVLDAQVLLFPDSLLPLSQYLACGPSESIVLEVRLPAEKLIVSSQALRSAPNDFPLLCVAAARNSTGKWRVAIGARPGRTMLAYACMEVLENGASAAKAASIAAEEISFGTNGLASAAYRRAMTTVLTERCILAINGGVE